MKKTYQFEVPALFSYEIEAGSEAEARKILINRGGIDIDGELLIESENYKQAKLIDKNE
tara:strand:+ start:387 stop:563 length:177 start_codon:yes stop_codon:yes gene_type:complete